MSKVPLHNTDNQARNQGGVGGASPALEKCVGHSSKSLGPSQKTLRPTWCPKLVTGLLITNMSTVIHQILVKNSTKPMGFCFVDHWLLVQ